jgi:hypothetical protein
MQQTEIKRSAELARRVGVHRSQITRWARRRDWPFGPPPWRESVVPRVVAWRARTLRRPLLPPGSEELAELRTIFPALFDPTEVQRVLAALNDPDLIEVAQSAGHRRVP